MIEERSEKLEIKGRLLVKNTALNFIGQVIPLFVAVVTVPYVIKGLGTERFGILSLAWVVLGYFSLLDLGLGRATTKFVAEALGKGEIERIPGIVWTSFGFVLILGIIGSGVLIALTPLLVERVLNVPTSLIEETKLVFYISSVSIPIILITVALRGILEAYQRFDLVNALRVPSNILSYVIPAIAIFFGVGLPVIVLLLLIKNFCMVIIYLFLSLRVIPSKGYLFSANSKLVLSLFHFGVWIALHNAAVAILLYLDRFLVGVFLTMSAVAYYTAPYELVNRTLIVPSSVMMVLFPAFSTLGSIDKERLQSLFNRAFKYLILIMGLVTGIIFVFSREILLLWLGSDFAIESTVVLQLFSIGTFFSSLAWLNGTLLQGIGKPRIVTIIHVLQVPIYIISTWLLIKIIGIEGAALSWTLRILLSLLLLLLACWKAKLFRLAFLIQNGFLKLAIVLGTVSAATITVKSFIPFSPVSLSLVFSIFIILLFVIIWKWGLDQQDRHFIVQTAKSLIVRK